MNNNTKNLPEIFNFTYAGRDVTYTATYEHATNEWLCSGADAVGNSYSEMEIEEFTAIGLWTNIEPKKALPSTFKFHTGCGKDYTCLKLNSTQSVIFCEDSAATWSTEEVVANVEEGAWVIVEPKKALPTAFKFKHADDGDLIYTATKQPEGDYKITWMSRGLSRETPWLTEELEDNIKTGIWNIVDEAVLKCENDANGETANIPPTSVANIADVSASGFATIYDPISFLMGAMNEGGNSLEDCAKACEDYCEGCDYEEMTLLEVLKEFTEHTGADVIITEGSYVVIYKGEEYNACCEDSLTDLMDAVATLNMANF